MKKAIFLMFVFSSLVCAGERMLEFTFPGLEIGIGEYKDGPTGCTVFFFPKQAKVAADIRGGSAGTIYTERLHTGEEWIDGIVFAGGTLMGLEAAAGVTAVLFEERGNPADWENIPEVAGAICYDFNERKNDLLYPDKALGKAAYLARKSGVFPLGRRGAGSSVTVGKLFGIEGQQFAGQGAAFKEVGKVKIAAFTVVNAAGGIYDKSGKLVRGFWNAEEQKNIVPNPGKNTTLTLVVTNLKIKGLNLLQLTKQIQNSMSRAIYPYGTSLDGDILFFATTDEVDDKNFSLAKLGMIASDLVWDAVLSSFEEK